MDTSFSVRNISFLHNFRADLFFAFFFSSYLALDFVFQVSAFISSSVTQWWVLLRLQRHLLLLLRICPWPHLTNDNDQWASLSSAYSFVNLLRLDIVAKCFQFCFPIIHNFFTITLLSESSSFACSNCSDFSVQTWWSCENFRSGDTALAQEVTNYWDLLSFLPHVVACLLSLLDLDVLVANDVL